MKSLRCDNCGYYAEVDMILSDKCPNCNNPLIIEDSELDDEIVKQLDDLGDNYPNFEKENERTEKSQVEQMEDNIKNLGNDRTWELIEQMDLASIRVVLRHFFFLTGGKVPTSNIEV